MRVYQQAILVTCVFGFLCIMYASIVKDNGILEPASYLTSSKSPYFIAIKSQTKEFKLKKTSVRVKLNSRRSTLKTRRGNNLNLSCQIITTKFGLCQEEQQSRLPHCIMTINVIGRLGNTMGQYATLFALAQLNKRPAFMLPEMARVLLPYFRISMPTLDKTAAACLKSNWVYKELHDWMESGYETLEMDSRRPLMLTGYPCSWTFFDHIRDRIRLEFSLRAPIQEGVQQTLRTLQGNRSTVTFIGVHARRTDYVDLMASQYRGVVADSHFFVQSMAHFRSRYADSVFVVASDDMDWCRVNIDDSLGDVYFAGAGIADDPIHDMALLSQCNHSIITIGTYGFWSAYLAGGETVHLTNYTLPDSPLLTVLKYNSTYLPSWLPIAADLSMRGTK